MDAERLQSFREGGQKKSEEMTVHQKSERIERGSQVTIWIRELQAKG